MIGIVMGILVLIEVIVFLSIAYLQGEKDANEKYGPLKVIEGDLLAALISQWVEKERRIEDDSRRKHHRCL